MQKFIFLFLFLTSFSSVVLCQKTEGFEMANKEWKNAEQALGLLNSYEVLSCTIYLNSKGRVLAMGYCSKKCQPQNCVNEIGRASCRERV